DQPAAGEMIEVVMVEAVAFEAVPAPASEDALSAGMPPVEPVLPAPAQLAQAQWTTASSPPPTLAPTAQMPRQIDATTSTGGSRLSPVVIALIIAVLLIAGASALFLTGVIHLPS